MDVLQRDSDQANSFRSAVISECGRYRYWLGRRFVGSGNPGRYMTFLMLNPSKADAAKDDPTIRRCMTFAKREGCDMMIVVNLFGIRSTNPAGIFSYSDPAGRDNDKYIRCAASVSQHIVVAWGSLKTLSSEARGTRTMFDERLQEVRDLLRDRSLFCLGTTLDGNPRHPLYVKNDAELIPWSWHARS